MAHSYTSNGPQERFMMRSSIMPRLQIAFKNANCLTSTLTKTVAFDPPRKSPYFPIDLLAETDAVFYVPQPFLPNAVIESLNKEFHVNLDENDYIAKIVNARGRDSKPVLAYEVRVRLDKLIGPEVAITQPLPSR